MHISVLTLYAYINGCIRMQMYAHTYMHPCIGLHTCIYAYIGVHVEVQFANDNIESTWYISSLQLCNLSPNDCDRIAKQVKTIQKVSPTAIVVIQTLKTLNETVVALLN